jgi:hypothetical protein
VTNLPVYLINSEQIGISEQFAMTKKFFNAKFDCTQKSTNNSMSSFGLME